MGEVQPPPPRAGPTPVDRVPGRTPDCTPFASLSRRCFPPIQHQTEERRICSGAFNAETDCPDQHSAVGCYSSIRTYHR